MIFLGLSIAARKLLWDIHVADVVSMKKSERCIWSVYYELNQIDFVSNKQ
jgi:hypothetical protein